MSGPFSPSISSKLHLEVRELAYHLLRSSVTNPSKRINQKKRVVYQVDKGFPESEVKLYST